SVFFSSRPFTCTTHHINHQLHSKGKDTPKCTAGHLAFPSQPYKKCSLNGQLSEHSLQHHAGTGYFHLSIYRGNLRKSFIFPGKNGNWTQLTPIRNDDIIGTVTEMNFFVKKVSLNWPLSDTFCHVLSYAYIPYFLPNQPCCTDIGALGGVFPTFLSNRHFINTIFEVLTGTLMSYSSFGLVVLIQTAIRCISI
ncbi:hypothetical protein D3Z51_20235, partial [Clostridiaceae bacterium]